MSAFSVVMPDATACSEYSAPSPISISVSERTMWVEERCTIVTSAPCLPQRGADVVGRVVGADHDRLLAARRRPGPGCWEEWCWSPLKTSIPRDLGHVRLARHAGRQHELLRAQRDVRAVALDDDRPLAGVLVVARALGGRGAPVVELHHPRVHLQPVADLVLRREHRPVLGELDVRQVVVPDRVVQAERLVALAPGVAGALVALDDDRRHAELAQPRAERDAALAAADDHDLGLGLVAELLRLAARASSQVSRSRSAPCSTPCGRAGPRGSSWPLSSCSVVSSVQALPSFSRRCPWPRPASVSNSIHASVTPSASVGGSRRAPAARLGARERGLEHVDALRAPRPS